MSVRERRREGEIEQKKWQSDYDANRTWSTFQKKAWSTAVSEFISLTLLLLLLLAVPREFWITSAFIGIGFRKTMPFKFNSNPRYIQFRLSFIDAQSFRIICQNVGVVRFCCCCKSMFLIEEQCHKTITTTATSSPLYQSQNYFGIVLRTKFLVVVFFIRFTSFWMKLTSWMFSHFV